MPIEEREGRGRCYFADEDYKIGDVIIDESPYAFVLSDAMFSSGYCAFCGCFDPASAPFATCEDDWARYCCLNCMEKDRSFGHMFQMNACQELLVKGVDGSLDSMRLVLKIAGKFKSEEDAAKEEEEEESEIQQQQQQQLNSKQRKRLRNKQKKQEKKRLEALEENLNFTAAAEEPDTCLTNLDVDFRKANKQAILSLDQGGKDTMIDIQGRFMVRSIASMLSELGDKQESILSCQEALFLLFAIQCNAHRVVDMSSGSVIGLGLFPLVSMLNHACDFNCDHEFIFNQGEKPRLIIKAVKNIRKGEECCYSYVPPQLPLAERRDLLKQGYGIDI
mmetsp:Transcript_41317/g.53324  ORF Transcript_41317/g.53324 Transcript_41317/m.53324 type:complete len:334 (+) Transcript_41317:75-1076(+)